MKLLLAKALNAKQEHKNTFVHLCSISEVINPSNKMTPLYLKIGVMWHMQVKSPTHYFGSFLIQTNSRGTRLYCLLLYSITGRALPQLHKNCKTFYRSNVRWPATSFKYWKKLASGMLLQKFILVNRRCLYKDNLKRTVFTML